MEPSEIIAEYRRGPDLLNVAVKGLTAAEWDAVPVPGLWSVRQVVCHIADAEIIYADRMKRVLAEDNPSLAGMDPDSFQRHLFGDRRVPEIELQMIESTRQHMAGILDEVDLENFHRTGVHSEDGPLTLETLLERITQHIPHHVEFINEKRRALTTQQKTM